MKVKDTIATTLTSAQVYFHHTLRFLKTPQKVYPNLVSGSGSSFLRRRALIDFDLQAKMSKEVDESTFLSAVTRNSLTQSTNLSLLDLKSHRFSNFALSTRVRHLVQSSKRFKFSSLLRITNTGLVNFLKRRVIASQLLRLKLLLTPNVLDMKQSFISYSLIYLMKGLGSLNL